MCPCDVVTRNLSFFINFLNFLCAIFVVIKLLELPVSMRTFSLFAVVMNGRVVEDFSRCIRLNRVIPRPLLVLGVLAEVRLLHRGSQLVRGLRWFDMTSCPYYGCGKECMACPFSVVVSVVTMRGFEVSFGIVDFVTMRGFEVSFGIVDFGGSC